MTEKENSIIINGVKYLLATPDIEQEDGICEHCHLYEQCSKLEGYNNMICVALFCEDAEGRIFIRQE